MPAHGLFIIYNYRQTETSLNQLRRSTLFSVIDFSPYPTCWKDAGTRAKNLLLRKGVYANQSSDIASRSSRSHVRPFAFTSSWTITSNILTILRTITMLVAKCCMTTSSQMEILWSWYACQLSRSPGVCSTQVDCHIQLHYPQNGSISGIGESIGFLVMRLIQEQDGEHCTWNSHLQYQLISYSHMLCKSSSLVWYAVMVLVWLSGMIHLRSNI